MLRSLAVLCSSLLVVAAVTAADNAKFDTKKLEGEWTYVSGVRAGDKVDKERLVGKVTFGKDTVTVPAGPEGKFVMAFKIDAKETPAKIDLEIKSGPVNEGKAEGIISIDGGELKFCYVLAGVGKRPSKFESTKENGAFYFVLKKAQ